MTDNWIAIGTAITPAHQGFRDTAALKCIWNAIDAKLAKAFEDARVHDDNVQAHIAFVAFYDSFMSNMGATTKVFFRKSDYVASKRSAPTDQNCYVPVVKSIACLRLIDIAAHLGIGGKALHTMSVIPPSEGNTSKSPGSNADVFVRNGK